MGKIKKSYTDRKKKTGIISPFFSSVKQAVDRGQTYKSTYFVTHRDTVTMVYMEEGICVFHIANARRVANKWRKTVVLLKDPAIARYIPTTRPFHPVQLRQMLNRYGMVVIKPNIGTGGHGIVFVQKREGGYVIRRGKSRTVVSRFAEMLAFVRRTIKGRRYLIQRGIRLAAIGGNPVDYRVKIQKPYDRWIITGMVGRKARNGLFVTNLCQGGTRLTFAQAVAASFSGRLAHIKKREMQRIARRCTMRMERAFPGVRQLGFDFGIDVHGKIWLFEVNTKPH
jgi:hypothetical protein